jgi:hypothetical protein
VQPITEDDIRPPCRDIRLFEPYRFMLPPVLGLVGRAIPPLVTDGLFKSRSGAGYVDVVEPALPDVPELVPEDGNWLGDCMVELLLCAKAGSATETAIPARATEINLIFSSLRT